MTMSQRKLEEYIQWLVDHNWDVDRCAEHYGVKEETVREYLRRARRLGDPRVPANAYNREYRATLDPIRIQTDQPVNHNTFDERGSAAHLLAEQANDTDDLLDLLCMFNVSAKEARLWRLSQSHTSTQAGA